MLNRKIFAVLFALLIAAPAVNRAQDAQYDQMISGGIDHIYSMEFEQAGDIFRKVIELYPNNPAGRFFLAMIDWWKILVDLDNESYDDIFFQKLEDVIYHCDQILSNDEDNVNALFFKGGSIGFRGRLRAVRESWLKAADDGREALPIVQYAYKLDPTNVDVQLGFGIYNYYAAVVPERYPLLQPLMVFFPEGDKEEGIKQLTDVAENGKYANYEAQYFLVQLYYNYENDYGMAQRYAQELYEKFPNNPMFERWRGKIAIKRGMLDEAYKIWSSVYNKTQQGLFGYNERRVRESAYYLGYYYWTEQRYDSSAHYFDISQRSSAIVDDDEVSGFRIAAVKYLAQALDIIGKRNEAVGFYNQLLEWRNYGNSHDIARKYLEQPLKK